MKLKLLISVFLISTCKLLTLNCSAQTISAGVYHSLAVCSDGTVKAWGHGTNGELGNGADTNSSIPVSVNSLTGIIAVAGGYWHSLALKNDGTVWAWGSNSYGCLGDGTTTDKNIPVQISSLTGIIAISGGDDYSVALKNDGTVWTWGYNYLGQLGIGSNTDSHVPVKINTLSGITAIAGGYKQCFAVNNNGTVWAWGDNSTGELGDGTMVDRNAPVQLTAITNVTAIASGSYHTLALKNGTVWGWGRNNSGELGNGNSIDSNTPVQASYVSGVTKILAGAFFSIALTGDGSVYSWGVNNYGQLGNGTKNYQSYTTPTQINSVSNVVALARGQDFTLALRSDGAIYTWGNNMYGALGNGTTIDNATPAQMTGMCSALTAVVGIDEITEQVSATVFPNPTNGVFKVQLENSAAKLNGELSICNVLGEKVYSIAIEQLNNGTIDLSGQANGIYFMNIKTDQGTVSQKIIIQK